MRKRFIRPIEQFRSHLDSLKEKKGCFTIHYVGNRNTISYGERKWVFGNKITDENRDIVFCCRMVKADCANAIKEGLVVEKEVPESFPTLIKRFDLFKKFDYWFRFDIESCYWNIAYYNVPFLSMHTYFDFYEKKDARNIALGSLGKVEVEEIYEDGKRISKKSIYNPINNIYKQVRHKAYEFFLNIDEICEGNVGFYHTDEFIIPDEYVDKVLRYLKKENAFPKAKDFVYYHVREAKEYKVLLVNSIIPEEQRFIL